MRPTDTLTTLFHHNLWANLRLLELCAALSSEQLDATISGAYGTIRDTLEHIIQGETFYPTLLTGSHPQPLFKWEARSGLGPQSREQNYLRGHHANH